MAYKRDGETVTLTMTVEQWNTLLITLGFVSGDAHRRQDWPFFYRVLRLVNSLNEGNPGFTPYEIPEAVTH